MKLVAKELDSLIESRVEEHTGRLNSEASSRLDFKDVMLTMLKDASLLGYSRETIIKAIIVVCFKYLYLYFYIYMISSRLSGIIIRLNKRIN